MFQISMWNGLDGLLILVVVKEGVYMLNHGIPPYAGNLFHHVPNPTFFVFPIRRFNITGLNVLFAAARTLGAVLSFGPSTCSGSMHPATFCLPGRHGCHVYTGHRLKSAPQAHDALYLAPGHRTLVRTW